jgi:hypothetical protein
MQWDSWGMILRYPSGGRSLERTTRPFNDRKLLSAPVDVMHCAVQLHWLVPKLEPVARQAGDVEMLRTAVRMRAKAEVIEGYLSAERPAPSLARG